MRFAQGKEAEKIVQRGVRTLSAQEKRRLGLSATNTYYVRENLRRVTRRSVLLSSRQARQARQRLGVGLSEVAVRALGRAGRRGGLNAVLRRNKDYREGRISLSEARRQFERIAERAKVSQSTLVKVITWQKGYWYVKQLADGNEQLIMSWESDKGIAADKCIEHLSNIVRDLDFSLVGYSVEAIGKGRWTSSVTVEREVALAEESIVDDIIDRYRLGEEIEEEEFEDLDLYERLVEILVGYGNEGKGVYTFTVRLTWRA